MLSLIACIGKNRALGKNNKLLWHIPEDLKHFKKITQGHSVIMGRKTFVSLRKPLVNRVNIIVTHDQNYQAPGCFVFNSLTKAISFAKTKSSEVFVIGGGQIYSQALSLADKLYLTIVETSAKADAFFPDYSDFKKIIFKSPIYTSGKYQFRYVELKRD